MKQNQRKATELEQAGSKQTTLNQTGANPTGLEMTGMNMAESETTKMKISGLETTKIKMTGLKTTGMKQPEIEQAEKKASPMSNEGRNAYVVQHLTDSLLELLKDKPLADISISELCSAAGVGRASFYRNYEDKENILKDYIEHIFHRDLASAPEQAEVSLKETIYKVFSHFEKYHTFYSILNERGLIGLLKDTLIELCGLRPEQSALEAYAKAFVAYSLYGWTEVWFQRGMQESAEEMADLFKIQSPSSHL